MTKIRKDPPRKTKELILGEFNHRCAICGARNPQVHHIDEDPSNNAVENLIPLCPNCHLCDAHSPTIPLDADKLSLFRSFKDPSILSPQFHPLHIRLQFLKIIDVNTSSVEELDLRARELSRFVAELNMGGFYSREIEDLLKCPHWARVTGPDGKTTPESEAALADRNLNYRQQLADNRDRVYALAVELLRYQSWVHSARRT